MTTPPHPEVSPPVRQRPRSSKKRSRSIWFHLHFWSGWIAAIPLILICFTGGLLSFDKYIRHWEFPDQFNLTPAGEPLTIDEIMEVCDNADPKVVIRHLGFPNNPKEAYSSYVTIIEDDDSRHGGSIIINPYTGELTHRSDAFSISGLIIDLHRHLAAGKTGQQIVAISSVVLAITSIFGLILWWPMRGRTFVRTWKRGQALDWHNALGIVAMVPLIIMSLTGICFTWGRQIFPVLEKLQSEYEQPADPVVEVPEGAEKLPLSIPLANLQEAFPDGQITGVQPTGAPTRPYTFFVRSEGVNYRVWMNPYTGAEISRHDGKKPGPVGWFRGNFGRLHTMNYHPVLSAIWGLFSVVGSVLAVTGVWISVKRWRRRKAVGRA